VVWLVLIYVQQQRTHMYSLLIVNIKPLTLTSLRARNEAAFNLTASSAFSREASAAVCRSCQRVFACACVRVRVCVFVFVYVRLFGVCAFNVCE